MAVCLILSVQSAEHSVLIFLSPDSWSFLTFICSIVEIKPVMLSRQTATSCHIRNYRGWQTEKGKIVHADMTDKQVHSANRKPRWDRENGSCSLLKGLVPFHTTGILLPGLQITLFFKQFSTTRLTFSYCFQALFFFTHWFGQLHQETSRQYENLTAMTMSSTHMHKNTHTHISMTLWKRVA